MILICGLGIPDRGIGWGPGSLQNGFENDSVNPVLNLNEVQVAEGKKTAISCMQKSLCILAVKCGLVSCEPNTIVFYQTIIRGNPEKTKRVFRDGLDDVAGQPLFHPVWSKTIFLRRTQLRKKYPDQTKYRPSVHHDNYRMKQ
jgi:hypothetical protein